MKTIYTLCICLLLFSCASDDLPAAGNEEANSQSMPTIMVFPSDALLLNMGYLREIENQSQVDNKKPQYSLPNEMTIQLPAIAIEIAPRRTMQGFQLGGGQYVNTDILFHCIAEDDVTRNTLIDIISYQNDRSIMMFNTGAIANDNAFPLNIYGYPISGALTYPQIISKYPGYHTFLKNLNVQEVLTINSNLYVSVVRLTTEIIANQL